MAHKTNPGFNVAIVGAGFGGLAVAIALKTKWGLDDFVIYERGADVGGTWRDNTYPGCASDVPIHFYSLSTDLKSDWTRSHGTQPEILEYMHKVTDKYGLHKHCRFHTSLDKAEWDAAANVWRIETRDVRTGETQVTRATAIVSAIGVLVVPKFPKLQGIESFKGEVFHSARWRHDVNLHGKRVGVLGNGSSAYVVLPFEPRKCATPLLRSQFIPIISKDPTVSVINFARTKMWFIPGPLIPYREFTKWIFAHIPLVQRIHRYVIAAQYELAYLAFKGKGNNFMGKYMTKTARDYTEKIAPQKYHHLIIPTYPLGCRRLVRDQGYLESLSRPNVRLTFDHIKHVESDGIVTETGEKVNVDVIIYGTGFVTDDYPLNLHGTRGTLKEYNDAHGGPTAYLGTTVPGFPNFFMMQGPNTTTGHTSVIFSEESQIPHILQLLAPVRSGALTSVVPTEVATDKYNDMLQERLDNSVWTQCASWYRTGARGRIFSTFPGPLVLLWWWLRKPRWDEFEVEGPGADAWRRRHGSWARKVRAVTFTLVAALGLLALVAYRKGMGVDELAGEAVRMWTTFWDWLGLGAGNSLVQGSAFRGVWDGLLGLLPQRAAVLSS
ncbi:FAD/NAD-P-binding domain-containing protein [Lactarius akahatsu]|uniref:FAD/NAD-P-binding domain-containing protein n=1 Tax=Lactarius akahatsu TaxID=416441 RepID=A0AAD4L856_9AGAM|nr:FAD/NAD-P-binding domain-containing protein [Lactarius akahatsu]